MSIGTNALAWAIARMGQTVGDGECWTLIEQALLAAGGRSSRTMTPGANGPGFARLDYVWGTAAALNQVARGDILQFRHYMWTVRSVVRTIDDVTRNWSTAPNPPAIGLEHHSAFVENVVSPGLVDVIHQNAAPVGRTVHRMRLRITTLTAPMTSRREQRADGLGTSYGVTIETTINEVVSGRIAAYRQ